MVRTRRVVIVGFSLVAWVAALGTPAHAVTNTLQAAGSLTKPLTASGFPTSPPAPICGNTSLLSGPAVRPTGAVEIDPGGDINAITQANPPGTTFWLSPGTFTLGSGPFNQIIPQNNDTYIGAPGAIIDGQGVNMYAFTQKASGVTIEYLTIQNFVPPQDQAAVNHDSGSNWTIQYDTIQDIGKAGMNAGPNSITQYSCITANGQTGINGLSGTTNVLIDHNELSKMATGPNAPDPSCGCEAGIKLFGVIGAVITNNWIHNNASQGVWGDTNAVGFLIQGNYINNNDDEAIFYETSYNAFITDNTILDNALVKGAAFAATGDSFPIAAVYISESGGDSRVFGGKYSTLEISNNDFVNNYGGVTLWEDANRFCGTSGNNAPGSCPIAGVASTSTCVQGTINNPPYFADCRWHTQNVLVDNNIFSIDKVALNCLPNASQSANPSAAQCGENSIFSDPGTSPSWTPYAGATVENAITFNQNNHFENNTYTGAWSDALFTQGRQVSFPTWQDPPFNQDVGSTITPPQTQNSIPVDTATLEGPTGSTGAWVPWFSSTIAQSTAEAHGGTHSLQVGVTASGWGVTLTGFPYFFETPGPKTVSFWAMTTSADSPGTTLEVTFYDSNGNALGTSNVPISALTGTWQEGMAAITAPAATSTVGIAIVGTGAVGDTIYLDDFAVSDVNTGGGPTTTTTSTVPVTTTTSTVPVTTTTSTVPATTTTTVVAAPVNALDGNTSTLEGGIGAWVPWYSDTIAQSTAQAHGGTHSLQVGVTQPFGWGVTLNNYPYFPDTPGTKTVSFWAMTTAADSPAATLNVVWLSSTGAILGSSNVTISALTGTWQQGSATLTAPAGTATVETNILGTGAVGDTVYVDDIFVTGPGSTGPTTTTTVPVTTTTVPVTTTTVPVTTTTVPVTTTTTVPVTTTTVPVTTTTVPVTTTTVPVTTTTVPVTTTTVPVTTTTVPVTTTTVPVTTTTVPATTTTLSINGTTTTVPVTTTTVPVTTTTVPVTTTTVPATTTTTVAPPVNALDANTSTLEGGIGDWVPWYSDTVAQSTAQAHSGTHSLQVGVTQPFGWGVTLNNYPYFPDSPGTKTVSFWAMTTSADSPAATMNVVWLSSTGAILGSSNVTISALTGTWQKGSATLTAPAGTATVEVNLLGTGAVGDTIYADDFFVSP